MKKFLVCFLFFFALFSEAQVLQNEKIIDSLYLEDQFSLGFSYLFPQVSESEINSSGLPFQWHFSYLRDIPLNKKRNFGVAVGAGYQYSQINMGLKFSDNTNGNYLLEKNTSSFHSLKRHQILFPIELRWRTSTSELHSFWRIYPNITFIKNISGSIDGGGSNSDNIALKSFIQDWELSTGLSFGYGTWNLNINYDIKPVSRNEIRLQNSRSAALRFLKIGLVFYML